MSDTEFYTATMAKVYAAQGHFEKAAEIYRYLLNREPDRQDLIDALSEMEKKLSEKTSKTGTDLVPLFSKWIDLMLRYARIQKLKKFQQGLQDRLSNRL